MIYTVDFDCCQCGESFTVELGDEIAHDGDVFCGPACSGANRTMHRELQRRPAVASATALALAAEVVS